MYIIQGGRQWNQHPGLASSVLREMPKILVPFAGEFCFLSTGSCAVCDADFFCAKVAKAGSPKHKPGILKALLKE
jgi:hypothetical protein